MVWKEETFDFDVNDGTKGKIVVLNIGIIDADIEKWDCFKLDRDCFKFCVNSKNDVRYVDSYSRAEPDFAVSALICIIHGFSGMSIRPAFFGTLINSCLLAVPQNISLTANESVPSPGGALSTFS